jgi:hypothetical protein
MSFVPGIPVYVNIPTRGWVLYLVPAGTPFMEVPMWSPVQPAAVVEHAVPTGANTSSGVEDDDVYVDAETGELLPPEMQAGARDFDDTVEGLKWVQAEKEKEEEELQHVAELLQEEDKKKEKAMELFVDANRKFQIQKGIYQNKGPRAELHAAQVAYINTVDELRAVIGEINEPTFTLRTLADERWPGENHDDFEDKLKTIYSSIKSKIAQYSPKAGVARKPVAAEKRAPAPRTLADMLAPHLGDGK